MNKPTDSNDQEGRPGMAVDSHGGGVIDPTRNVLDLVHAESKYQDAMREALASFQNAMRDTVRDQQNLARTHDTLMQNYAREAQEKLQNWMRDAESKRVDQLSEVRQTYEKRIADMLAESVRTTSTLVSTQLVQIQATFDTRVSKLEAYQFTQAGRSSVADPAMSDAMNRMASGLSSLESKFGTALLSIESRENRVGGREMGKSDTNARLLAIVMACAAVASPVVSILVTIMVMRGGH